MSWVERVSEFLAPKQEASNSAWILEQAARESERRIVHEELARAARMEQYAAKWTAKAPEERSPVLVWSREASL